MKKLILDGHKLAWHSDRVKALLRGERIAPLTVDMALTKACTYKCSYCFAKLQDNTSKPLTLDIMKSFFDDAAEIGVKAVSFVSDGESTCSPILYDVVKYGKGTGIDIALGTNGFLLRDDKLEELLPDLTYLRFNISAASPERYQQIHGTTLNAYLKVINTILHCVSIKNRKNLPVTIGMQMVLLPEFQDQIIPLSELAIAMGVDYLVIKHCSDDENGTLGVDYSKYESLAGDLKIAESMSTEETLIAVKWSKIKAGRNRSYKACYGPPLFLQLSGSGLVAPCGSFFNDKYKKYHIGNIAETRFMDIWKSERYWQVMDMLKADSFDARNECACLCLQHKCNEYLDAIKKGEICVQDATAPFSKEFIKYVQPSGVNFI